MTLAMTLAILVFLVMSRVFLVTLVAMKKIYHIIGGGINNVGYKYLRGL